MRMYLYSGFVALLLAITLAACTTVPQTPRQTLAYSEASFTAAVQKLSDMRDNGELTAAQQDRADTLIHRGNADLDAAHAALMHGNDETAQGKLSALDNVLNSLRDIIRSQSDE